uniref:Rhabdovirus nucleocapsid domain-containing protein n=1 Tax=Tetranychus urticae TaxID=32264 RepID=T1KUS3_TETUR
MLNMASSESEEYIINCGTDANPKWIEIETKCIPFDKPANYPNEYFKISLPSTKPSVSLPYKNVPLDTLRPVVVKSIKDGTISSDLAALFLWKYGERLKATLDEKWESFGVTICEPGEVKLSSIIDVHFGAQEILSSIETDGMVSSNDDNWIASFLTSIYRINCAKNENYRLELSKTASNIMFKNFGEAEYAILNFLNVTYRPWISNDNYIKIIAAYDMFLFKTNIKKYQFLRWGTISSRYRECSVLSTWIDISNECGFTNFLDLRKWVFVDSIEMDLTRVLKDGQEIDKPDSYTPYLHDLRLSCQSPYSCSNNPALYAFLSTLGVYIGRKGSMNVRMVRDDYEREATCFNGLVVAYLLQEKNCEPNKSTEDSCVLVESYILGTKEVRCELADYIEDKGTDISGPLEEFKKSIDVTIVNPRPDTIGHYLKHCFK